MAGNCKYYKRELYYSLDSGQTWSGSGVYSQGALIASASTDCGYVPPIPPHDYSTQYLTFRTTSGSMRYKLTLPYSSPQEPCQVYYSLDSGNTWVGHDFEESTPAVPNGSIIMWKGTNTLTSTTRGSFSSSGGTFEIEGNLTSLSNMQPSDVFSTEKSYYWSELFLNNTCLTSAENLYIPKVESSEGRGLAGMFAYMFSGCTNLVLPPDFSHVSEENDFISTSFFKYTFADCTSLTTVPNLSPSITSISTSGCCGMFQNCTSLTTVPKNYLTAELQRHINDNTNSCYCYAYMFQGCTSLVSAPDLLSETVDCNCYRNMFQGCTSLTTSPLMANTRTFLQSGGCRQMFEGCTSLSAITCLARGITSYNDYTLYHWVDGVAESGEFNRLASGASWSIGIDGIPSGWIIRDVTTGATYWSGTTSGSPYCMGNDKYIDIYHQISSDSGSTWTTTAVTPTLVEANSEDCGYVPPHDYSTDYLTVKALGSGDVSWSGSTTSNTLSYSTDSGSTWSSPSTSITISVNSGDTVLFKGECTPSFGIGLFSGTTASFDVEGNPMSLLFGDNFSGQTSLSGKDAAFYNLFRDCTTLINAENLSLLATTLEYSCYANMFRGCTSLTTAPSLPATTLANHCYFSMFENCSSLTTAPILLATKLEDNCYRRMFQGCSSLSSITCLAIHISASRCTDGWVNGVASSGTFTTPSDTSWDSGDSGIPNGWTRVNI